MITLKFIILQFTIFSFSVLFLVFLIYYKKILLELISLKLILGVNIFL